MRSKVKLAHKFQRGEEAEISKQIISTVRKVLRVIYENSPSAIKIIQRDTSIHERSIRNWYEGRNPPSASNLILLAKAYPEILSMILRATGHEYLMNYIFERNVPENVPDQFSLEGWNRRQNWILAKLALHHKIQVCDVARVWSVTKRTAKRDLAGLKYGGYIIFIGCAKTGRYVLRTAFTDRQFGFPAYLNEFPPNPKNSKKNSLLFL